MLTLHPKQKNYLDWLLAAESCQSAERKFSYEEWNAGMLE